MDNIERYGLIEIPPHLNDEERGVVVSVNVLYWTYKARYELQEARVDYFKNIPVCNMISKIKSWNDVRKGNNNLHTHFKQFVKAYETVMKSIINSSE